LRILGDDMVDVVVVGTVGIDTVETPFGKAPDVLGGSATYAAWSTSFFAKPGMVSIIGEDFPQEYLALLQQRAINLDGVAKNGKTFRWQGLYEYDLNEAKTLRTELNCLETFNPQLPEEYKTAKFVLIGNTDPEIQMSIINQMNGAPLVMTDTMNLWIDIKKDKLLEVVKKTDIFVLNEGEARQLFDTPNLIQAGNKALQLGPRAVIIKKGEHGALLFTKDSHFSAGSYPLEIIKDPTGCGDTFAGALMGYLAKCGELTDKNLRKAIMYGSVVASFNAEDFSLERMKSLSLEDIEQRFTQMRDMREF
jgi:sugar/nucleoside kinase (ribokinase family)